MVSIEHKEFKYFSAYLLKEGNKVLTFGCFYSDALVDVHNLDTHLTSCLVSGKQVASHSRTTVSLAVHLIFY